MNERPHFTAEQYTMSSEPYEYLYSLKDNQFMQSQEKERLAKEASALKVKTFSAMWKSYLSTILSTGGRKPDENYTEFSGLEEQLSCGRYVCDDTGIYLYSDSRNGGQETVICSHPIAPVRRLINIDDGSTKIEIAFSRGKGWKKQIFQKSILASSREIVSLATQGIGVDSENARDLVRFLSFIENANYNSMPEQNSVGRLGWIDEATFSPYVENVVFDGSQQFQHIFNSVTPSGEYGKWLDLALRVRSGKSIVCRIILAASFASVLLTPMDALPFIVHVWGGAGAGKTVGLMLAASVWAMPSTGEYIKTFNSTAVGLEFQAAFCGSLPFCLDELQCIKDQQNTFDKLIYMLCEGVGRMRGTKFGGLQKTLTWRNCTISTGEQPITQNNSGGGAMNRVIELDCKEEKLFDDPRGAVQIMTRNYGHAGKNFVKAFTDADKGKAIVECSKAIQSAFYDQLIGKVTDKQALSASIILTADTMAEQLIFSDGKCLTVDDLMPYLVTQERADANIRAYNWLIDTITSSPGHFEQDSNGRYQGECWGKIENDEAYIIKSVFDRLLTDAGFSASSLISWAARNGKIRRSKGANTVTARIPGNKVIARCICVKLPSETTREESVI